MFPLAISCTLSEFSPFFHIPRVLSVGNNQAFKLVQATIRNLKERVAGIFR